MSTLLIRFVGVFIVLAILMIGMLVMGMIVSRALALQEARKSKEMEREKESGVLVDSPELEPREEELAAAIGAAIAFSMSPVSIQPTPQEGSANGSWALAGRMALMGRRLPAGIQRRAQ
jgi:Na+-transporting methylmalonyl-CoA/oxaloacetate decarboxylase gamma subunit